MGWEIRVSFSNLSSMKQILGIGSVVLALVMFSLAFAYNKYVTVLKHPTAGAYLADAEGKSLYIFTNDTEGSGESTCYGGCAGAWPPYLVDTTDIQGHDDFVGELSVITRTDGALQLAYNGMPLYYYVADAKAGDITGHEVGGVWFLAAYGERE